MVRDSHVHVCPTLRHRYPHRARLGNPAETLQGQPEERRQALCGRSLRTFEIDQLLRLHDLAGRVCTSWRRTGLGSIDCRSFCERFLYAGYSCHGQVLQRQVWSAVGECEEEGALCFLPWDILVLSGTIVSLRYN